MPSIKTKLCAIGLVQVWVFLPRNFVHDKRLSTYRFVCMSYVLSNSLATFNTFSRFTFFSSSLRPNINCFYLPFGSTHANFHPCAISASSLAYFATHWLGVFCQHSNFELPLVLILGNIYKEKKQRRICFF